MAKSTKFIFILVVLFGSIGTVASDLYLPSLPAIAISLHTTISLTQISVAMYVLGVTGARVFTTVLSDAFGRKIPLIISLLICLLGTLGCLYANNISMLLIGRLLQGIGGGGSNIIARVIMRDRVSSTKLAEYSSYYSMMGITIMAAAPLLGGYLQHFFGWHASFTVILIYTLFALIIAMFVLPETNIHRHKSLLKPQLLKRNFIALFADKSFIIYALLLFLGYGIMLAWLTSGPVVLQKVMHLTPIQFGWYAGLVGFCYFLGAFINSRLVGKCGIQTMMRFGIWIVFIASLFMLIPILIFHYISIAVFVGPVMLAIFGLALVMPNSFAAGLTPFAKTAGLALAVLGSVQTIGGFAAGTIISMAPDHNQLLLGLVLFVSSLICIVLVKRLTKYNLH